MAWRKQKQTHTFGRSGANVDSDSDSSIDEEERESAKILMNMKQATQSKSKVFTNSNNKNQNAAAATPKKSRKPEAVQQQTKNDKPSGNASAKPKMPSTSFMGLDNFKVPGKAKGKQESNQPTTNVRWPFEKYDFRLACLLCFRKQGEGIHGYVYQPQHSHKCPYNILIIRPKDNTSSSWFKIRPRPNTDAHFQIYKLCEFFRRGERCRIGEASCTFGHSSAEIDVWNKDREREFIYPAFMKAAQQEGVVSLEILESRLRRRDSQTRKDSVSSTGDAQFQPTPSQHTPAQPTKTAAMQYQPQIKQVKIPSSNQKPPSSQHLPEGIRHTPSMPPNFSVPPPPIPNPIPSNFRQPPPPHHPMSSPSGTSVNSADVKSFNQLPPGSFKSGSTAQQMPAVMDNPLPGYHFELCCKVCLTLRPDVWLYDFNPTLSHLCTQDTLAYCIKDDYDKNCWVVVRERISHRDFKGNYALCHSVVIRSRSTCNRQNTCSFAHNMIEKQLWGLEKSGQFNITEFILQRQGKLSTHGNMSTDSVQELIGMYGGYFRYICRKCFFSEISAQVVSKGESSDVCAGKGRHPWASSCVLAHVHNGYTVIDKRKFTHHGAYYKLCKFLNYCYQRSEDLCIFAHSKVEMSVWRLERDSEISRDEIVRDSSKIYVKTYSKQANASSGVGSGGVKVEAKPAMTTQPVQRSIVEEPPVRIGEFCRTCWGQGQKSQQEGEKDRCARGHSNFKLNSVFIALSTVKEIRTMPPGISQGMKFVLCHAGNKCQKNICTFPHSHEELDTWTYMARYNIKKLGDLVTRCQEIERSRTRKISTGESVVNLGAGGHPSAWTSQAKPASQIIAPGDLDLNEFYCLYCSISCSNQTKWDDHCVSPKHQENVLWDKEHMWNYRQPPWGQTDSLQLCASHKHNKSCRYSAVPERYNLCKYAHSQEELDEWKERHEFRKMKRQMALQRHMFSYTESLLEQFNRSDKSSEVMSESIPGIGVKGDHVSSIFKKEKDTSHVWTFTVHSKKPLEKVSLLLTQDRLHFHLLTPDGSQHQVCAGNAFVTPHDKGGAKHAYSVQVSFNAGLFGSFRQWLALDFGSKPVLIRKLVVDVGHQFKQAKVEELRKNLDFDRWTNQTKSIVPSSDSWLDEFDQQLMMRYKEPVSVDDIVTSDSLKELNRHNYVHKMHKLIELEEITRHRIIASYNVVTEVTPLDRIDEFGVFIMSQKGEVFLKISFSDAVTEDTEAGKLLMSSMNSALIAPAQSKSKNVYEAHLVKEINYGYDGLGKDYVYLSLSQSSVKTLNLTMGRKVCLEIQFQMDRLLFCRMHYALDSLKSMELLFPDVLKFKPLLGRDVSVSSNVLNDDQMKAVRHIVIDRDMYSPPFIMYGPFGTGKTETLAQATMSLLLDKKPCRVLICAQSNSAANLYITKHFDDFCKKYGSGPNCKILRILDQRRKVSTVEEKVLQYCYREKGQFAIPSKEVIMQYQVILVTVESSIHLTRMDLHGVFSHIFVDEAGQTLECQILMPLCLASTKTCVVLTGDHLQTVPPVYSLAARQQCFDVSILVRLFNYYDSLARGPIAHSVVDKSLKSPLKIQLSINYRTKLEILRFISTVFYGGPDVLKAYSKVPAVLTIKPLTFYSVQGEESQNSGCTSYMNPKEAMEVVSQVSHLLEEWPREWGPRAPETIAVITNYREQVKCIRHMLKTTGGSKKLDLRRVYVDSIQAVQGKEFRAVFISTVRTTNLLQESHILDALAEGRDIGDLGFLSNPKLLNTALTRAQSFVGVVGDPIALCLIGDCIQEWRTYIKHCTTMTSIHPPTHTYDFVRNRVVQLQYGPEGKVVDMLSRQKENKLQQSFPPLAASSSTSMTYSSMAEGKIVVEEDGLENETMGIREDEVHENELEEEVEEEFDDGEEEEEVELPDAPPFIPMATTTTPTETVAAPATPLVYQEVAEEIENSNRLMMDSLERFFQSPLPNLSASASSANSQTSHSDSGNLLLQHKQQQNQKQPRVDFDHKTVSLNNEVSTEDIIFQLSKENISGSVGLDGVAASGLPVKSECIRVSEKNGFACLSYSSQMNSVQDSEQFRISTYDEDFVIFSCQDMDSGLLQEYDSWSGERLKSHIGQPGYFRCRMTMVGEKHVAVVLPPCQSELRQGMEWTGKEVEFLHQFDRGHALVGDQVLVELSQNSTPSRLIGQVKGILRSPHDKTNRLLVCEANPLEPGVLRPIDKTFTQLYSLLTELRLPVAEKGIIPVYKFVPSTGIEFDRYQEIKQTAGRAGEKPQLFIVRYLAWAPKLSLPVGIVVGTLDEGSSLDRGMDILNIDHDLSKPFQSETEQVANQLFADPFLAPTPPDIIQGRANLTNLFCFAITEEEDAQEVEMAIHMEQLGQSFKIGLHVADVASFIQKDSIMDRESEYRSPSLYPPGRDPRPMLPTQACGDVCSLQTNCDRLGLSVLMVVDDTAGQRIGDIEVVRSVVNVKHSFTISEVEHVLLNSDMEEHDDFFQSCLVTLFMLSTHWRTRRLGNSSFANNLLPEQQDRQHAQLMMEELKHQFNAAVGSLLDKFFPQCTPLLVQPRPSHKKMDTWRRECAEHAFNSIPMSRSFLDNEVCRCSQLCTCVFGFMRAHQLQPSQHVLITQHAWKELCQVGSPDEFDAEKARDLISDVKNLPQLSLCDVKFAAIQQPEYFACSGLVLPLDKMHYGMNVSAYAPFTSPLQNFICIVVQRLLMAYLDGTGSPYTTQEVAELCAEANGHQSQKSLFDQQSLRLHLGAALQTQPLITTAVIEKLDGEKMVLSLRDMDQLLGLDQEERTLTLTDMTPANVKVIDQVEGCVVNVQWEERIYNYSNVSMSGFPSQFQRDVVELDPNRLVFRVPSPKWQQLLNITRKMVSLDAREEEFSAFTNHLKDMDNAMKDQMMALTAHPEPTCQEGRDGVMRQQVYFSTIYQAGQCVSVQLGAHVKQGLLTPSLKLVGLSSQLDLCLEHRVDPQACFCLPSPAVVSNKLFTSTKAYQNHWTPLLVSGSAQEAVREGERVTIHGVGIAWHSRQMNGPGDKVVGGKLTLSRSFLERSKLQLPEDPQDSSEQCLAFACVRYKGLDAPDLCASPDPNVTALLSAKDKVTWVGHCIVTGVRGTGEGNAVVTLRLVQSVFPLPSLLMETGGDKIGCTVEWIAKGQMYSVLENTVRRLSSTSQFVQDLVLGRKPSNPIDPVEMPKGMYLDHMSPSQQMALGDCYRNPFTFVLGGPGTGKSILASCLAALLVFRNAKVDLLRQQAAMSASPVGAATQLLVCAPTEHSLDNLTGYIKTLNQNMNLVRVYSEDVEEGDFPTVLKPGDSRFKPRASQSCAVMKDIALHHLIRTPGKSVENDNLLQQEMLMSMYGDNPAQAMAVQAATGQAQRAQLAKAHIILCTCLTSARKILQDFTNVKQIIVDDGGHCSELECLVPAMWHPRVQQLVVLGDQHLPHPSPTRQPWADSLGPSLIHRLADVTSTTLTQQFRCTDNLCEFPSGYFYSGLLSSATGMTPQAAMSPIPSFHWPSRVGFHSLFCHVEGSMETGAGGHGHLNKDEAAVMRDLVWAMVVKQQVNPSAILILTFSSAQAGLIQNAVMQVGLSNIAVCTVEQSIGRECQFVLVSTVRSVPESGIAQPPLKSWVQRHLGAVADPYLINIAITRAQKALFIFGNKNLLSVCEPWRSLLDFYRGKQALVSGLNL